MKINIFSFYVFKNFWSTLEKMESYTICSLVIFLTILIKILFLFESLTHRQRGKRLALYTSLLQTPRFRPSWNWEPRAQSVSFLHVSRTHMLKLSPAVSQHYQEAGTPVRDPGLKPIQAVTATVLQCPSLLCLIFWYSFVTHRTLSLQQVGI